MLLSNSYLALANELVDEETYYKFWIALEDKDGTNYTIEKPEEFLSQKAIERRKKHGIKITKADLPVNAKYVSKIADKPNVKILYTSKWLNAVAIQTKNEYDVDVVEDLDFVKSVQLLGKWTIKEDEEEDEDKKSEYDDFKPYAGEDAKKTASARTSLDDILDRGYGNAYNQTRMLNLLKMHDLGYRGNGVTIAVIDAGFKNYYRHRALDSIRNNGQLLGYYNIAYGDTLDNDNGDHGLAVLSCMASNVPNKMIGTAPGANYLLISSEDQSTEFPIEEANWVRAAEYADSSGVDIITSSLGYKEFDNKELSHTYKDINGKTSIASQAATMASERGIIVLVAAGNDGNSKKSNYISCPGDAEKILTVGGVDYDREHTSFSSYGPTYDKRTKPDICAKARYVYVADDNNEFTRSNGTSFATPIMAGAVACLLQANPDKSVEEIMEALKKSADHNFDPNNSYGYGIPDIFVANSFLNKDNSYFDYETERLINPGINDFTKRIYYRFYSPTTQTVKIRVTQIRKGKKNKVVYEKEHTVQAKEFLQGEIPKVEKFKNGDYLFELITPKGKTYSRNLEK